jgi:hypothetical protein
MHTSFATITRGLDRDLPPMRLDEINRVDKETEDT